MRWWVLITTKDAREVPARLRYFLEQMKTLQDDGTVQWATQLEAYEAHQTFLTH